MSAPSGARQVAPLAVITRGARMERDAVVPSHLLGIIGIRNVRLAEGVMVVVVRLGQQIRELIRHVIATEDQLPRPVDGRHRRIYTTQESIWNEAWFAAEVATQRLDQAV